MCVGTLHAATVRAGVFYCDGLPADGDDLAAALGTAGYMSYLCRTASGIFSVETSVPFEELTAENIRDYIIPTDSVLPYPVLEGADARIFHGVGVEADCADGLYKLYRGEEFYGLARVADGVARAEKKLC